jgi:hypothetical protein
VIRGRRTRTAYATGALALVACFATLPAVASAAPQPGSLEEQCVTAGTELPLSVDGFYFNHHPEKKREPRGSDGFLTVLETVVEFDGLIPAMPANCAGAYEHRLFAIAEFRATRSGARWNRIEKRWRKVPVFDREIRMKPYPYPPSPISAFDTHLNTNSFGLGCTMAGRLKFKLEVVDVAHDVAVARRIGSTVTLPVDSWFQARCLGRFSIQESGDARSCGARLLGTSERVEPTQWGVKVKRVSCGAAARVAEELLRLPALIQRSVAPQKVGSWRCYLGHRGAAACSKGNQRLFMLARGNDSARCEEDARKEIERLRAEGVACDAALALASAVRAQPQGLLQLDLEAAGQTWSCTALQRLGDEDLLINRYACFSANALVTFEVPNPSGQREAPVLPTTVAADVVFPPAGLLGFPKRPFLRFDYQEHHGGRIKLPLKADEALVGRRARIEISTYTQQCVESADPSEDAMFCFDQNRVRKPARRTVTLAATQMIDLGRIPRRGNWEYFVTATTEAFGEDGIAYRKKVVPGYAGVANDVAKCPGSPLCGKSR